MKKKKVQRIPLTGALKNLIGNPELRGSWFIMGESGQGKSTGLMQMCKELSAHCKVDYNSLEEEDRASMGDLLEECKMDECRKGSFMVLTGYQLPELYERLNKPRSARIVVIDSLQYFDLTRKEYMQLLADFDNKLFIFNSHAEGKKPVGSMARFVKFHSDVKLRAQGFKIFSTSRMNRGKIPEEYIVWDQGAQEYWRNI